MAINFLFSTFYLFYFFYFFFFFTHNVTFIWAGGERAEGEEARAY